MNLKEMTGKQPELQIAPLIDVVFLLLIYFMVSASLVKKEADLSFMLPVPPEKVDGVPPSPPIEVLIEVRANGDIIIEGVVFGADSGDLDGLAGRLFDLNGLAKAANAEFVVTILPSDEARHGRIINVMDACARADVKNLSFSMNM